jgi:lipopolysaccharide biosynthesis glycosyltransferase
MTVLFCVDRRYATAAAVAVASLASNASPEGGLDVWLLHDGLPQDKLELIRRAASGCNIRLLEHEVLAEQLALPVRSDYISAATFGRFLVGHILPDSCERVLYLDCDILILKGLGPLWELDLEGHILAAAVEYTAPTLGSERGLEHVRELGLPPLFPYFNAGVLLIDLRAWRQERVGERAARYVADRRPKRMDQDALNAVVAGRWMQLDPIWNVANHWYRTRWSQCRNRRLLRDARIVHYVGHRKPWVRDDLWQGDQWLAYLWSLFPVAEPAVARPSDRPGRFR